MNKIYAFIASSILIFSAIGFTSYNTLGQMKVPSINATYYFETVRNNCSINIVIEYGQNDAGNSTNVTKPVVKGDQITLPAKTSRLFLYDASNIPYEIPNSSDCSPLANYIPGRYFVKNAKWNGNENILGVEIYDVSAIDTSKTRK